MRKLLNTLLLFCAWNACADADWQRYETIIERKPFGAEPPLPEMSADAPPSGAFAREYRLCMLYKDAQGQQKAGLVSKVNNRNVFLAVGETDEGILLAGVRLEEGIAVLEKGGERAQLILEGLNLPPSPVSAPGAAVAAGPAPRPQYIRRTAVKETPAHILAALTDSSPKRPQMTVRKSSSGGGGSTAAQAVADTEELRSASRSAQNRNTATVGTPTGRAAEPLQTASLPLKTPGGYVLQSVPPGFEIDF